MRTPSAVAELLVVTVKNKRQ